MRLRSQFLLFTGLLLLGGTVHAQTAPCVTRTLPPGDATDGPLVIPPPGRSWELHAGSQRVALSLWDHYFPPQAPTNTQQIQLYLNNPAAGLSAQSIGYFQNDHLECPHVYPNADGVWAFSATGGAGLCRSGNLRHIGHFLEPGEHLVLGWQNRWDQPVTGLLKLVYKDCGTVTWWER